MTSHNAAPVALFAGLLPALGRIARLYAAAAGFGFISIGLIWVLYPTPGREAGVQWVGDLGSDAAGIIWIVGGALGMFSAYAARVRPLRILGWVALTVAPALMSLVFAISWALSMVPGLDEGSPSAFVAAVSYGIFAAGSLCCSRVSTLVRAATGGKL